MKDPREGTGDVDASRERQIHGAPTSLSTSEQVSDLRSAAEAKLALPWPELPDARVEDELEEIHRGVELLEAARLRAIAEIDRRRTFERDGHLSAASWVVTRFKVAWGHARSQVRLARFLEQMPRTQQALEAGEISTSGMRLLAEARHADPEAFERSGDTLLQAARRHSVADLARVIAFWRERVAATRLETDQDRVGRAGACTPRCCWTGWCGWTVTWIQSPVRACSPPLEP